MPQLRNTPDGRIGRPNGWALGFGVIIAPWLLAGVISTFLPNPETAFPWVFLVAFVATVSWTVWMGIRRPHLRRGIALGSLISVVGIAALLALLWVAQP